MRRLNIVDELRQPLRVEQSLTLYRGFVSDSVFVVAKISYIKRRRSLNPA